MEAVVAIVEQLALNPDGNPNSSALSRPLFIGLQGPQGSGKSYISALLKAHLTAAPLSLNVALLSIDDLYLPHSGLVQLAAQHPDNPLWRGRGQPGTHDVDLGLRVLRSLRSQSGAIELPRFDKSLFDGQGDRLPMGLDGCNMVQAPVDIVILEGWCVGFYPISQDELESRWEGIWREEKLSLGLPDLVKKVDLEAVNNALKQYVEMWSAFDFFVQIKPKPSQNLPSQYSIIYQWRLEQEHNMKATNGGRGMSDENVKAFVDRYIPGYVFFGDIPASSSAESPMIGRGLRLLINEKRHLVDLEKF